MIPLFWTLDVHSLRFTSSVTPANLLKPVWWPVISPSRVFQQRWDARIRPGNLSQKNRHVIYSPPDWLYWLIVVNNYLIVLNPSLCFIGLHVQNFNIDFSSHNCLLNGKESWSSCWLKDCFLIFGPNVIIGHHNIIWFGIYLFPGVSCFIFINFNSCKAVKVLCNFDWRLKWQPQSFLISGNSSSLGIRYPCLRPWVTILRFLRGSF